MAKTKRAASVEATDEFATAMQQLSAEAEKSLPENGVDPNGRPATGDEVDQLMNEFHALNGRVQMLETTLLKRLDEIASDSSAKPIDFAEKFGKIEQHLAAIRTTESVNQRLFDSLHEELLRYRDNFLHESLQKPFIRDLVVLFDDLSALSSQLSNAANVDSTHAPVAQWHDNLENALHSLMEILHRFDVIEIEPRETVDRSIHKVVSYEPADFEQEDGCIMMRVKRGFLWRGKLLRPEEVIAKRFG